MSKRAGTIVAALLLAACGSTEPQAAPLPDPPLPYIEQDPLGDTLSAAAGRLEADAMAAVGDRGVKPEVRRYLATEQAAADLPAWYASRAAAAGWTPLTSLPANTPRRGDLFGYEKGSQALVIGRVRATGPGTAVITLRYGSAAARQ